MSTGLVLFAHGARDPRWADTVVALAGRIAALSPGTPVQPAYLEFLSPDLDNAVEALVAQGVDTIVVAPVFLAAGGHVLRDLPRRLAAISAARPGLVLSVEPALGGLASVLDAMAHHCVGRLEEVARGTAPVLPANGADGHKKGVDAP